MIVSLTIFNSASFLIYGLLCIFTKHMDKEFKEFGLSRYRVLTGIFEICGATGSLIGYFWNSHLYIFSTLGLTILMLLGVYARLRAKQPFQQSIQALIFLFLNAFLFCKKLWRFFIIFWVLQKIDLFISINQLSFTVIKI